MLEVDKLINDMILGPVSYTHLGHAYEYGAHPQSHHHELGKLLAVFKVYRVHDDAVSYTHLDVYKRQG